MQLLPSGRGERRAGDGEAVVKAVSIALAAAWVTFLLVAYNLWMPWSP